MKGSEKHTPGGLPPTQELTCTVCGGKFLFRGIERQRFARWGWQPPKRCPLCRQAEKERQQQEEERLEREEWQRRTAQEKSQFETKLASWNVVPVEDVAPRSDRVLYILGNGFDLMHRVRSSYYAFRDTLGKNSNLRQSLENYLTPADIWADFESALAHLDVRAMASLSRVDSCLDVAGFYEKDAGAAEYCCGLDLAVEPMITISDHLHRRFQDWVDQLAIGTKDRPLAGMFRRGKVLCFNYTEFVEQLYGIPEENVCYIHGCRRKKKGRPRERLVLGHMPGASDAAFDFRDNSVVWKRNPRRRHLVELARMQVLQRIADQDVILTKDSEEIIAAHQDFFDGLKDIEDIIVIGHSFFPVDWGYFTRVAASLAEPENVRWHFSCHGLQGLKNLERLLPELNLTPAEVSVFRTDGISTAPLSASGSPVAHHPTEKIRDVSPDGRWAAKSLNKLLMITDQAQDVIDCEIVLSTPFSRAYFTPDGQSLFLFIRGVDPGVLLFSLRDSHWRFVAELMGASGQSLVNPRLKHVFLTGEEVAFVYHGRVRRYRLDTGEQTENRVIRDGESLTLPGEDVRSQFMG